MVVKKKSRWSILKAEATKDYAAKAPYLFDAVEPPIEIQAPSTVEEMLAIASILDNSGAVSERDFKSLLATLCGDAFPAVWDVLRHEPFQVLLPFIDELNSYFSSLPAEDAEVEEVPGKELDSSS